MVSVVLTVTYRHFDIESEPIWRRQIGCRDVRHVERAAGQGLFLDEGTFVICFLSLEFCLVFMWGFLVMQFVMGGYLFCLGISQGFYSNTSRSLMRSLSSLSGGFRYGWISPPQGMLSWIWGIGMRVQWPVEGKKVSVNLLLFSQFTWWSTFAMINISERLSRRVALVSYIAVISQ